MIFTTGDTHIPHDVHKLKTKKFLKQKELTKEDFVIICGDFGGVWSRNIKEDKYWLKWLKDKPFTTLFVDGNHENFDLLNEYDIEEWNGGKVHYINESVIHLMRGQVYTIQGKKIFTMGGASSIDKQFRKEGKSWWQQELPSVAEYIEAVNNLSQHNWTVDYIITHTTSMRVMKEMCDIKEENQLNQFFNMLENNVNYKHWYFGHFHEDLELDEKHTLLYNKVIRIV